jgi:hypothetical protein
MIIAGVDHQLGAFLRRRGRHAGLDMSQRLSKLGGVDRRMSIEKEVEQQVQAKYRQCQKYRTPHLSPPFGRGERSLKK